jgi:beta-glucosidase
MNRQIRSHPALALSILLCIAVPASADDGPSIEVRVAQLLQTMTIEQKVGQMTQVTLGVMIDKTVRDRIVFDRDILAQAVRKYQVGSILNTASRPLSLEQWHEVIRTIQDEALKNDPAIPVLYGIDSIHGANYMQDSTLFPHNIGMAATRNPDLVKRAAKVTAMETRAAGLRWNFDPVFDVGRNPLWSRFPETFGEDGHLVATLGVAAVTGYEEDGLDSVTAVASCMKHFVGYSDPANGKDRTPAYIPDVVLWEQHLPPFEAAVSAGASTIMINSASINGMPLHANCHLLTDVLRGQFGFEGLVVSDWEDVVRLHTRHRIAETPREAVRMAVEAGLDMSMVPHDFSFAEHLVDLVRSGAITEARLDESVAIILRLKMNLGLFDNPYAEQAAAANFGRPEYAQLALESARESITLLKNESDVLPLPKGARVLVAGPAAHNLGPLHGSWSYTWQGADERQYPKATQTVLDAITARLGQDRVSAVAVEGFHDARNYDTVMLRQLAEDADYIVLVLGERAYAESPGALDDLNLEERQKALARAAALTGKPVILLLIEGRPRIVRDIEPAMDGILLAYRPGSQGASAIADVLFGDYNPNGVLPYSYPQFTGDIMPYDHGVLARIQQLTPGNITHGGYKPQWPFGFGLSYTTFEYSDLELDRTVLRADETLRVSVAIRNAGERDGLHTVELFVSDLYASLSPAVRKLRAFRKVMVRAGETVRVGFELDRADLTFVNADLDRVVEPGEFRVGIGGLAQTFTYRTE